MITLKFAQSLYNENSLSSTYLYFIELEISHWIVSITYSQISNQPFLNKHHLFIDFCSGTVNSEIYD